MYALSFAKICDQTLSSSDMSRNLHDLNIYLSSKYYAEYFSKEGFVDNSFIISYDAEIIGYCICYQINGKICFPTDGAKVHFLTERYKNIPKIYNKIFEHIDVIAKKSTCSEVVINDVLAMDSISAFSQILLNNNYSPKLNLEMLIGYKEFDHDKYYSNIRKSYKSLINWGKRNLEITIINKENLSRLGFESFKHFHAKVSGRQTRTDETWEIQYQMLEKGFGELILANYQGSLVAGSLFIDQFNVTIYFTGVYERALFEFGISHYLLYLGITRSYERGRTSAFSLGCYETNIEDRKLFNIQFFKKGFCDRLAPYILWNKQYSSQDNI